MVKIQYETLPQIHSEHTHTKPFREDVYLENDFTLNEPINQK